MRAIWNGALAFGLIYIPVKLYDATSSHRISLELLRKDDLCKVKYVRVCGRTGEEVSYDQIVKGYQYKKGEYVTLEPEDFIRANVEKSQTVAISGFVSSDAIDHKLLEKPYYLEPIKGASRAYALLVKALEKSGKAALSRYVMKTREHLAVITPQDNVLVLNQMRFADEIRPVSQLAIPAESVSEQELEMAVTLIEQLSIPWEPQKYHDTYYEDLQRIIRDKIEGRVPEEKVEEVKATEVSDLFQTLTRSLEEAKRERKAA